MHETGHVDVDVQCGHVTDVLWNAGVLADAHAKAPPIDVERDRSVACAEPVGFVTGYVRPDRPHTLLVWQVAVDGAYRGRGLAASLLDGLVARVRREHGVTGVETTITPGNTASERLFTSFAERHGAPLEREVLFPAALFPDGPHDSEVLYRIGPLSL